MPKEESTYILRKVGERTQCMHANGMRKFRDAGQCSLNNCIPDSKPENLHWDLINVPLHFPEDFAFHMWLNTSTLQTTSFLIFEFFQTEWVWKPEILDAKKERLLWTDWAKSSAAEGCRAGRQYRHLRPGLLRSSLREYWMEAVQDCLGPSLLALLPL